MAIGILSLTAAALFGIISLLGAAWPGANNKPVRPAADYKSIYRDISPKEL